MLIAADDNLKPKTSMVLSACRWKWSDVGGIEGAVVG